MRSTVTGRNGPGSYLAFNRVTRRVPPLPSEASRDAQVESGLVHTSTEGCSMLATRNAVRSSADAVIGATRSPTEGD